MDSDRDLRNRLAELERNLALEMAARQDAEALVRHAVAAKQQFLANMSHELRTPLNGLVAASELAQQLELDTAAQGYLDIIHRSALGMVQLVECVLDAALLDAGRLELNSGSFDARAALADAVACYGPAAACKGLALSLTGEEGPPLMVVGDRLRFGQVVAHLVDNAVKFTDTGAVDVSLHVTAGPGGTCDLTISVRDSGPGVRPEDLERIFALFAQADASASRAHGGTGLGLCLCQGLARLMGGALGVSSVYGKGAAFHFRVELPVGGPAVTDRVAVHGAAEPVRRSDGDGAIVLLVEDNPVNCALAERILARAGCRVDVAGNGAEAVLLARERSYDIIFMDLQMPVMDGLQAAQVIRRQEGDGPRVPIVALTANAMPGDREACLEAGMDDHLAKPVRSADLTASLRRWCSAATQPA
ncbi:MAG: response regulator [bacterium]|nr:response regulator [bacterium]